MVKQGWSPNCPCLEDVDANLGEQREPPSNCPRGQASTTVPEQGSHRTLGRLCAGRHQQRLYTTHRLSDPRAGTDGLRLGQHPDLGVGAAPGGMRDKCQDQGAPG